MKQLIQRLPNPHKIGLGIISLLLIVISLFPSEKATASRQTNSGLEVGQRYELSLTLENLDSIQAEQIERKLNWTDAKVKSGDSLALIFKRLGLSAQTLYKIGKTEGADVLKKIHPGETLKFGRNDQGELISLHYPLSSTKLLKVEFIDDKYQVFTDEKSVDIETVFTHANISSNFWSAGVEAGLSQGQIMNLANIFGWDIDFALDIRAGDEFSILYEKRYADGEFIGYGNILAAEFINQGERFAAVRFKDGEYYSEDGRSMRKAFLRAPVNFKYISSNFTKKRFHPVQKRWKAHRGVDYAASTGTPVVSAGHGKVIRSTYDKYNGNHVFIQHGDGIVTKYLHFSKRKVKKGDRVKQGQLIGLVGSTGLASGPHLHYEFLLNGVHRNPRTVKLPKAAPMAKEYKAEFETHASDIIAMMNSQKRIRLAMR